MLNQTLLRKFTAGFIPLLIFIFVDALYGTEAGLIAAMVIGFAEFIYYFIRYRQVEKFILFDIVLILLLGAVSLSLDNAIFFKLKPALIEAILAVLLGIHAFSDKTLLLKMGQRYMKNIEFAPEQQAMLKKLTHLLFWVVLIHIVLIVYAAYQLSDEAWAFISGGLFYIIFGLIFIGQMIYFRLRRKDTIVADRDISELFDIVNPDGKIIGTAPRVSVHGNPNLLHPVIHVHVFNHNGQIFLQRRSKNKDVQPGKWDTSIGGHVNSGEKIEDAVKREALEELGIKNLQFSPLYRYVMKNDYESELVFSFRATHNGPFRLNREEIDYGRFWKINEVEKNLGKGLFTPNFEQEFALLKKNLFHTKKSRRKK